MKPIPALLAVAITAALVFAPMAATAAGSVAFSSPASGSSYSGTTTINIAGTVTPAPGQTDSVFLVVKNPSGNTVWSDIATVNPTTGAFSDSTTTGGSSYTLSGAYTISATDSFSAVGSTSFTYTAPSTAQYNVTKALINIQGNLTLIQNELKTDSTTDTSILNNLNTLSQQVTTLSGTVTQMSQTINGLNQAIQAAQTAAQNAETAANNANNSVSSTQTYVLVVAVLAAITLVLELAILVRKLS